MSQFSRSDVLVDTQWLMERLGDPDLRIVEFEMSPDRFANAHLPGAVFWHIFTDFLNPDLSINFDPQAIANLLSRSGITPETTVIGYGNYPDTGALIFWFLKTIGHERVYVLDGGQQKWVAEQRPVVAELSQFPATDYPVPKIDPGLRVLQPEVLAAIDKSDRVLLDTRTTAEYRGEVFMMQPPQGDERAGRIPGAINIEHLLALNPDGTFKSIADLQALYGSQGVTADKEIFTYCAVGGRSACSWFALKYLLGYPRVRNYDGSWNQWSRLANVPIEQG